MKHTLLILIFILVNKGAIADELQWIVNTPTFRVRRADMDELLKTYRSVVDSGPEASKYPGTPLEGQESSLVGKFFDYAHQAQVRVFGNLWDTRPIEVIEGQAYDPSFKDRKRPAPDLPGNLQGYFMSMPLPNGEGKLEWQEVFIGVLHGDPSKPVSVWTTGLTANTATLLAPAIAEAERKGFTGTKIWFDPISVGFSGRSNTRGGQSFENSIELLLTSLTFLNIDLGISLEKLIWVSQSLGQIVPHSLVAGNRLKDGGVWVSYATNSDVVGWIGRPFDLLKTFLPFLRDIDPVKVLSLSKSIVNPTDFQRLLYEVLKFNVSEQLGRYYFGQHFRDEGLTRSLVWYFYDILGEYARLGDRVKEIPRIVEGVHQEFTEIALAGTYDIMRPEFAKAHAKALEKNGAVRAKVVTVPEGPHVTIREEHIKLFVDALMEAQQESERLASLGKGGLRPNVVKARIRKSLMDVVCNPLRTP